LGHEVKIFSLRSPFNEIVHPEVERYDLVDKTWYPFTLGNKAEKTMSFIKSLKAPHLCSNNLESIIDRAAFRAKFDQIKKALRNDHFDILHAHFNGESTLTAMRLSKKLEIPYTFTGHAIDIFANVDIQSLKERMQNSSRTITPSYYNSNYLQQITGISEEKIAIVRACTMLEKFRSILKKDKGNIILSVGRLVEKKGMEYAILGISELVSEYPEIKYRIIGSGPLENKLKSLVFSLNLQKTVTFLGSLDDHDYLEELKCASIFILPCIRAMNGDMDACPLTIQEAMIAKTPVISTRFASIPELIEHKKEGLLVNPKRPSEIADALRILLEDKRLRSKLGQNGRRKIEEEFNIKKEVPKLVKIWESSCNRQVSP
jgi:colanic acid/amylovoran biosynthesis glycosyltransferase